MTTKLFASGAFPRSMFPTSTSPFPMLRGPAVTYAEDDGGSGGGGQTESGSETEGAGAGEDTLGGGGADDDLGAGGEQTETGGEGGEDTAGGGGGDDSLHGGDGDDEIETPRQRQPWQNRRIDKLTADKNALLEENARLKREKDGLAALGGDTQSAGGGVDTQSAPSGPRTYTEEEVERRANEKASLRVLNDKVDSLYDEMKALDPKFVTRLPAFQAAAADALATRVDFWQAITKFPNGAAVMNELTKDLDQLTELLEMGPVDMGIELAKLSGAAGAAPARPRISKVPAPPKLVTETRTPETDLLALDDDAFADRRAQERAAHREKQR